jgi:hypothetical protein
MHFAHHATTSIGGVVQPHRDGIESRRSRRRNCKKKYPMRIETSGTLMCSREGKRCRVGEGEMTQYCTDNSSAGQT